MLAQHMTNAEWFARQTNRAQSGLTQVSATDR
jgi:hypothetical protein